MTERSTVDRAPIQLTNTALGASATDYYPSSQGQDRMGSTFMVEYVRAMAWANVAGTLTLEDSDDRSTWATVGSSYTVSASTLKETGWVNLTKRYWRWKYVNGGTAQTTFKLFEDKTADSTSVTMTGSSTLLDSTNASVTTVAATLAASTACNWVVIQADPDNTADVFVGNSTSQSIQLVPGQSVTLPVTNLATVYVKSASGTMRVNYNGG